MARKTPADSDLSATPKRVGKRMVWPSGYSAPVVAGGAPAPLPTFPDDMTTLSIDALQALIDGAVAWSQENATAEPTDENFAAMTATSAGYQRAVAELGTRTPAPDAPPADPVQSLAEMAASMVPVSAPAVAAVVAPTDPPAGGGQAAQPAPAAGGFSRDDLVAAVTAGVQAALPAPVLLSEAQGAIRAAAGELQAPDLDALSGLNRPVPTNVPAEAITPDAVITAAADVPGLGEGAVVTDSDGLSFWDRLGLGAIDRTDNIRGGSGPAGPNGEMPKTVIARLNANFPPERTLMRGDYASNMKKIAAVTSPKVITAAGGRCVPAIPYYGLMVDAGAERPLLAALTTFMMERMAVTVLAPPTIDDFGPTSRTVTDGATNSNTTVTSASAAFLASRDGGASISGGSIPVGAIITAVNSPTSVTISAAATTTAANQTLTITRKGPVSSLTQAEDAAMLDAAAGSVAFETALKRAYHVTCPAPTTYDLEAIYWFLEFGNWTAKAFPEQIPAAVQLALAVYARVAENKLLTKMKAASTAYAPTVLPIGAIRAYISDVEQACEYLRNRHRLPDSVTLRLIRPRWLVAALSADVRFGSGSVEAYLTNSRAVVNSALAELNVVTSDYIDSAVGDNQLFAPGPGNVQGAKLAAAGTLNYPSTAASFLFPEGSFLAGVSSSIDFGVWRDTWLNERNNYRMGFEGWETIVPLGYEMIHLTHTLAYNGTAAGAAYGSNTLAAPVAIPTVY